MRRTRSWLPVLFMLLALGGATRAAGTPPTSAGVPFERQATLEAGAGPNQGVVALGGSLLVVANSDTDDLSLFRLPSREVLPRIPVGEVPAALALDPGERFVYVSCFRGQSLVKVDLGQRRVVWSRELGVHPRDVVLVNGTLLVAGYYEGLLLGIDPGSGEIRERLDLGIGLQHLLVHPDGERAYLLKTSRSEVYELGTRPLRVLSRLDDELEHQGTWDFVLSRDGRRLVISQWNGNRVAVLATGPLRVEGFVETGGEGPCALDLAPDQRTLVVAHSESDDAALVDIERLHLREVLPVGPFPFSDVWITPDGAYALVTADNARKLAVLDLEREVRAGEVAVGRIPHALVPGPGGQVFVSNTGAGTVDVLQRRDERSVVFERLHDAPLAR